MVGPGHFVGIARAGVGKGQMLPGWVGAVLVGPLELK